MQRKYYEAYEDRYRQIHEQNLQWFCETPSPIVLETIREFSFSSKKMSPLLNNLEKQTNPAASKSETAGFLSNVMRFSFSSRFPRRH